MDCHTLIQNVSAQCIPNLVALRSFRPRRVVWIYTPQTRNELARLRAMVPRGMEQIDWLVKARKVEELHGALAEGFGALPLDGTVVYHLTGGTKSMALQGLFNLGLHRRLRGANVLGVVMNPETQVFDALYPEPRSGVATCAELTLSEILRVHGNAVHAPGRDLAFLRKRRDLLAQLRSLAPEVTRALGQRDVGRRDRGWVSLQGGGPIPRIVCRALGLLHEGGLVRELRIEGNRVYAREPAFDCDVFAYVRDVWMEDWTGAVLAAHLDGWQAGFAGVKVRFGRRMHGGQDIQEFDFLGARRNRLVYWSCKRVRKVRPQMLFEIDALRDEVGGRDHHFAGLVYMGHCSEGLRKKASRLGVKMVDVTGVDAEEQLLCCRT